MCACERVCARAVLEFQDCLRQQVYDPERGEYRYTDKYEGRKLNPKTFVEEFRRFFMCDGRMQLAALARFIDLVNDLNSIRKEIGLRNVLRIYSSSLLLLYEPMGRDEEGDVHVDMKMIDFAHTHSAHVDIEQDDGYDIGIANLLDVLRRIASSADDGGVADDSAASCSEVGSSDSPQE